MMQMILNNRTTTPIRWQGNPVEIRDWSATVKGDADKRVTLSPKTCSNGCSSVLYVH